MMHIIPLWEKITCFTIFNSLLPAKIETGVLLPGLG